MAKWRVYNRHPEGMTHREKYKEQMITIPAGGFVLMDYEDAVQFRGQYFPMKKNAQGAPDPASFKVIHLEPDNAEVKAAPVEFICHFDGRKFPTQSALDQYLTENYADKTFKDEALEETIKEETQERRGPGRPAKGKTA